jgi:hypothetical protein
VSNLEQSSNIRFCNKLVRNRTIQRRLQFYTILCFPATCSICSCRSIWIRAGVGFSVVVAENLISDVSHLRVSVPCSRHSAFSRSSTSAMWDALESVALSGGIEFVRWNGLLDGIVLSSPGQCWHRARVSRDVFCTRISRKSTLCSK